MKQKMNKQNKTKDYKQTNWWKAHEKFVQEIKQRKIPFLKNDGKPLKEWKLFETWDASRDAARDAAGGAARDAAGGAARGAAWDAARGAARGAAGGATWDAAGGATWDAARGVAWSAARDAALYTQVFHVCFGLKIKAKFKTHAKKRWQVWQKGYGLLCDVNGKLYVYKRVK